ncbi:transcriptional regulator [Tahibacter sp.]|uniref:transcriptional regulator n=1 Tax=Tahibacter sp. TaxID=2056211 RepID=UPI0028C385F2|nr:transcriptional regulator [Tahibacter sp.]
MTPPSFRFGGFELDPAARELHRDGTRIELPSSAFDGLVYLVRHRDRAVGRDELMAAIWGRADVADSLLGQTLVRLRRALGDSGDTQQWIRTVPRFGYRWVGAVEEIVANDESAQDPTAAIAASRPEAETVPIPSAASIPLAMPPAPPAANPLPAPPVAAPVRPRWPGIAATAAVAALLLVLALSARREQRVADGPTAGPSAARAPSGALALVLPARVDAGEEWAWLRLGLMDLIASRLRRGDVPTASSESVVALLRERTETDAAALLGAPDLAAPDSLRVLPEIELRHGQWRVQLRAQDRTRRIDVETRAGDAMTAARDAADTLLLRLGHLPPENQDDTPQDLAELLQRSRAAMLADQLELAGELIRRADPALRARPEIALRQAQIELRAGDYLAVEQHLVQLLDTIPASRDAELRGRALVTLAASYIRRERPQDAAPHYDEAIALLQGRKAPDALGLALLGRGLIATLREDYDTALADLGLARSETEAAGNALGTAQVDLNLGLIEVRRLRPATALPVLTEAAARFQRLGAQEEYVFTVASIAEVQQLLLDHAGALATTERYWPPQAHSQNLRLRHKLAHVRAEALLETGALTAAAALADTVLAQADAELDAVTIARSQVVRARIAAARDDAAAAAAQAGLALTPVLQNSDPVRYVQAWLLRLRALRQQGDLVTAARETGQLREWVDAHTDPWRLAYASLAEAEQRAAGSDAESALPLFEQALRQLDAAGAIPDDVVEVVAPYVALLVKSGRLDAAKALSARVAPWSDRDLRAAGVFVRIHTALGRTDALEAAERRVRALAGERPLP